MRIVADSRDRAAWLAARERYVCGSEVAQMLCSGYAAKEAEQAQQRAQLVMLKAGMATPFAGNESTRIGQLMEEHLFAPMARELLGWHLEPFGKLVEDAACSALAATPDFLLRTPWGLGVVQTKDTTAQAQEDCKPRRDGSPSEAAYASGAPLYYALQLQAELACTGLEWGALLVLHSAGGGKKLRSYPLRRHEGVIARIRAEAPRVLADAAALKAGKIERVA
jgi:predicted phage-related endonuclease